MAPLSCRRPPGNSLIAVAFEQLMLTDILDAFCPPQVTAAIPDGIRETVLNVGYEDVEITIAPQETQIGELTFEQGITVQGTMNIMNLRAFAFLNVDQDRGVIIRGDVEPIDLGVFKLTGANDTPKPSLHLDLRLGQRPTIDLSGKVELLGLRSETVLHFTDESFEFATEGQIFDKFNASLHVSGSDLNSGGDFMVDAHFRNDLFAFLRKETSRSIKQAADAATRDLSAAQADVRRAQADVNQLTQEVERQQQIVRDERAEHTRALNQAQADVRAANAEVTRLDNEANRQRQIVRNERAKHAGAVKNAETAVRNANSEVRRLDNEADRMRQTIRQERTRDQQQLAQARRDLTAAQKKVKGIQRDIDNKKKRIRQIDGQIAAKKRWLDNKPWFDHWWAGPEYAAYAAAKKAEQGALWTAIGGLETAKHSALLALEGAKQVVRGLEKAADTFPIDMDPRVSNILARRHTAWLGLKAAEESLQAARRLIKTFPVDADPRVSNMLARRHTAWLGLQAAQKALDAAKAAVKTFPVDLDPRVSNVIGRRDTAIAGLEAANLVLEGVKQTVGGLADVAQFIADVGLGGLLDVHEASFSARLNAINAGRVAMRVRLVFMGEPQTLSFNFNFVNPLHSAEALAEMLLPD